MVYGCGMLKRHRKLCPIVITISAVISLLSGFTCGLGDLHLRIFSFDTRRASSTVGLLAHEFYQLLNLAFLCLLVCYQEVHVVAEAFQSFSDCQYLLLGFLRRNFAVRALQSVVFAVLALWPAF